MDKSSKELTKTNDIQMDVVEYLLYPSNKELFLEAIPSEKCLEVFQSLVEMLKPCMNYLSSEFRELKEMISKEPGAPTVIRNNKITYANGLTAKTRVTSIVNSYGDVVRWMQSSPTRGWSQELYLTNKGTLVTLVKEYTTPRPKEGENLVTSKLKSLEVQNIDHATLGSYIEEHKSFFKALIFSFKIMLSKVIEDRNSKTKFLQENLDMFERVDDLVKY